jgi:hypothetical protein
MWYSQTGYRLQYNTEHALCMLGNEGYRHTLRIWNNYCFTTATMVTRTRLNVTLHVHCLSCYFNTLQQTTTTQQAFLILEHYAPCKLTRGTVSVPLDVAFGCLQGQLAVWTDVSEGCHWRSVNTSFVMDQPPVAVRHAHATVGELS